MATKPRSEWSDAYRRRVERAEAKGKNRQAARGHRAHEHVIRKQKEKAKAAGLGALTSPQRAYARRIGREFGGRAGDDPDDAADTAVEYMTRVGAVKFKLEVARQRGMAKQYRSRKGGAWESAGMAALEHWSDDDGFPDPRWYYYH